ATRTDRRSFVHDRVPRSWCGGVLIHVRLTRASAVLGPRFAAERAERLRFVLAQRARPTLERMVDRPVLAHQPGEVSKPVLDDLRRMDVHGRAGRESRSEEHT